MKTGHFKPIGVQTNSRQEYRWSKTDTDCPPHVEAEIRDCFARAKEIAFSHIQNDNKTEPRSSGWSQDLDPSLGRVMLKLSGQVSDCLFGERFTPALTVEYCPESGGAVALDISSQENNFKESVRWNMKGVESLKSERHLKNGSKEMVSIEVDSAHGILLLVTQLEPAGTPNTAKV